MINNFTGADGSGKTTLAEKTCNLSNGVYTHFDKPKDLADGKNQYFGFLNDHKDDTINYICDRFHEGEWVYAPLYRGYTGNYLSEFEREIIKDHNYLLTYVTANLETIITRTRIRGEDFVKEEHFQTVLNLFNDFLYLQKMPFIIVDTSTAPIPGSLIRIQDAMKKVNNIWGSIKQCIDNKCDGVIAPTPLPRGNVEAKYMIVGQNPGGRGKGSQYQTAWSEGQTPEFLNNVLKQAGIYLDCWFTNLVLCSTENNSITTKQANTCIANLEYQIQLINPDIIFALGEVAAKTITKKFPNKKVIEVAHPTYIKRFYSNKPDKIQEYIDLFKVGK